MAALPARLSAWSCLACPGQMFLKGGCQTLSLAHASLGFPFHFFFSFFLFVARALNLWGMACVVCGGHVWLFAPPLSSWGLRPCSCTVFTDDGCTLLDSEAPPWLVFGDCSITVHYEIFNCALLIWLTNDLSLFQILYAQCMSKGQQLRLFSWSLHSAWSGVSLLPQGTVRLRRSLQVKFTAQQLKLKRF